MERDLFEITALKILLYLYEHGDAADPLDHVVEYWVRRRDGEYIAAKVSQVLNHLLAKGLVQRVGQAPVYKLNPAREYELTALVELVKAPRQ